MKEFNVFMGLLTVPTIFEGGSPVVYMLEKVLTEMDSQSVDLLKAAVK
jgi:hypothetical protein